MEGKAERVAEFYITLSLLSRNEQKRVFAIISLSQLAKLKTISPPIMVSTILMLLNSDS